jgi:hypothetical protein
MKMGTPSGIEHPTPPVALSNLSRIEKLTFTSILQQYGGDQDKAWLAFQGTLDWYSYFAEHGKTRFLLLKVLPYQATYGTPETLEKLAEGEFN